MANGGEPTGDGHSTDHSPPGANTGDPTAARVVWSWKDEAGSGGPSAAAVVRRRALVRGLIGAVLATLIFLLWSQHLAIVVFAIVGVLTLAGLASPRTLYRYVERALGAVGFGLGVLFTWLTLVPIYYLVFAPFGVLGRRRERADLQRGAIEGRVSYWTERGKRRLPLSSYRHQF